MSGHRLTFLALNVSDLAQSLRFYRDLIGVSLHRADHDADLNDPWYGGDHAAVSWTDGAFIHFALYPCREPNRPVSTAAQVGFHVDDVEAIDQRLRSEDVIVVQPLRNEPWGRTARYLDPDGNIVSITQR